MGGPPSSAFRIRSSRWVAASKAIRSTGWVMADRVGVVETETGEESKALRLPVRSARSAPAEHSAFLRPRRKRNAHFWKQARRRGRQT